MSAGLEGRLAHILAAGAVAVATAGLLTAYRSEAEVRRPPVVASRAAGATRAPTYTEERARHHDNRLRHAGNLRAMVNARPDPYDAGVVTEADHAAALARRAERRAYAGAPPTVPHPTPQQAWPHCMECHGEGVRIGAQAAPAICHTTMQSCVQCHVTTEGPVPGAERGDALADNTFVGLESPARGERAWPGAPPTVPHPTLLRSRCDSCHGVYALGLRTSHPWRQSCVQCHASSAELDQRAEGPPP